MPIKASDSLEERERGADLQKRFAFLIVRLNSVMNNTMKDHADE